MLDSELYDRESNDSTSRASAPADGVSRDNSPGGRGAGDLNPSAPAAPVVPAALFQPPAPVLFQPPTVRPEPVAPPRAESQAPASGSPAPSAGARDGVRDSAGDGDGHDGPGDDDDGAGAGRRRRRRSSRGRGRNGEDAAADAGDSQPESPSQD